MKSRLIQAFFNGTCRCCGKKVLKGENVWFAKHYGVRCPTCGPHTAADTPLPSKKKGKAAKRTAVRPMPVPRVPSAMPSNLPAPSMPAPSANQPEDLQKTGFVPFYSPAATQGVAAKGPDGVARLFWSSVSELVEDAFRNYAQNADAQEYLSDLHKRRAGSDWANGHTEGTLRQDLASPQARIVEAIESLRQELIGDLALPTQPRRKVRRGLDWGDELDADRFLAREPNAWERSIRETAPRRTVTIGVNLTVSWSQKPEELLYRGAAAVALADLLTQRGVNVRILGFSVGEDVSSTTSKLVSMTELKAPDMPLDVSALATAVCDVGFFRMVVMPAEFRHLSGKVSHGLGIRGHQYLPGPDRMSLDYLVESRVTTREAATSWLREQLADSMSAQEVCHV